MLKPSLKSAGTATRMEEMTKDECNHEKHGNRAKGYGFVAQKACRELNGVIQVHPLKMDNITVIIHTTQRGDTL
jgi:hypothetical protein